MVNTPQTLHTLIKTYANTVKDPKDDPVTQFMIHIEKKIADHYTTEIYLQSCTAEQLFATMIATIELCIEHKGSIQDQENIDTELTNLVLEKLGSNTSSLITGLETKEEVVQYIVSMIFEELN